MDVDELMTGAVTTVKPQDRIRVVLQLMEAQSIRHLPVVEQGRLVGMVSDRDVREYRFAFAQERENPACTMELLDTPVADAMTKQVIALNTGDSTGAAIDLMVEHRIGAVPVLDWDTEALVGILSYVDVLRSLRPLA